MAEPVETQFQSVYEFVDRLLAPLYATTDIRISEVNWARRWWAHPEVVARLDGLWRRYEQLRTDEPATFMETFLRGHADYHMRQIMKPGGVFEDSKREDTPSVPLPTDPIPTKKKAN